jgi:Tol biopolymer transport system component
VKGEPQWVTTGWRRWSSPDPSPRGDFVAFYSMLRPEGDVYISHPDGTGLRQLTGDAAVDRLPRWSPDGRWLAFFSNRTGELEVWKIRVDGSELQQLTQRGGTYFTWAPDGRRIAGFRGFPSPGYASGVYVFDPNVPWARQRPEQLPPLADPPAEFQVTSWSPDGRALVGQTGAPTSGIVTYALQSRMYDRLADFGEWPEWLPDSRRVMFVARGNAFYVADSVTKQVRKVFSTERDVIGPPRLTGDGRTVYFSRRVNEADIWVMTLDSK